MVCVGTEADGVMDPGQEGFPRFHVNAMQAFGNPFDLTIDFGWRLDQDTEPETQARLTMSWEHAASTAKVLQSLVDEYEKQAGKLPDLQKLREEEAPD